MAERKKLSPEDPYLAQRNTFMRYNDWLKSQQTIQAYAGPWFVLLSTNKAGLSILKGLYFSLFSLRRKNSSS